MDYTLDLNKDGANVVVTATCLLNQDIRRRILMDVASAVNDVPSPRVLIDLTEATFNYDEPMAGALELTVFMRSIGIAPETKLAFLHSDAEGHRMYFQSVAQMDGFNLRYFKDRGDATRWLNQ